MTTLATAGPGQDIPAPSREYAITVEGGTWCAARCDGTHTVTAHDEFAFQLAIADDLRHWRRPLTRQTA